jgi:molybdopterin molybdotransferase
VSRHEKSNQTLLSFDQARSTLAGECSPLKPVTVRVEQATGLYLAEAPRSDVPLPHFDSSTMDGYAVRAADLESGKPLPCHIEIPAGSSPPPLPEGEAARIFTGAVIPDGADTVVQQELATVDDSGMVTLEALPRGKNIRYQGELLQVGDPLGVVGEQITPWIIARLVAGGAAQVHVTRRPKVSVIVTGSELCGADEMPANGHIRDSNGPMLSTLIEHAGFVGLEREIVSDDLSSLTAAFEKASQKSDVILTSGGVSVGDYDFVPAAVEALGGEILFHRLAMKPGKPILVAQIGQTWLVGLPGNPVSVLCGWRFFAAPLLHTLMGSRDAFSEQPVLAILSKPSSNRGDRTLFVPSILTSGSVDASVEPLPWKGSHDIVNTTRANSFLRIEANANLEVGNEAAVYPL